MLLAKMEHCDENKVLKMCLFHDIAEARTWDANFINKHYGDLKEREAQQDQLGGLPIKDEMLTILEEYIERTSIESIVAKDADCLDQLVLEQEHFYGDDTNRNIWQAWSMKKLKTNSAKQLAQEIIASNPLDRLYALVKEKRGGQK